MFWVAHDIAVLWTKLCYFGNLVLKKATSEGITSLLFLFVYLLPVAYKYSHCLRFSKMKYTLLLLLLLLLHYSYSKHLNKGSGCLNFECFTELGHWIYDVFLNVTFCNCVKQYPAMVVEWCKTLVQIQVAIIIWIKLNWWSKFYIETNCFKTSF